ncbi:DNA helicase IV [Pseudoalteromonas sp. APC 3356]|jgi:DNA helicase-4|uniref:DNA helicase IV n=1 Tax=unclassified Pseudoalteromonas TaxID=194690 RepID=UPI0001EF9337|nr:MULTISPECIES: DNA helicase IV [unclassified Pseudoalteromonas]ADT68670.1 DNA helicase IV [Pseudoalteromonas sp. SM9913]MDN3432992.1 DNA helicase IV [Pseudoalteromonas sp. APC 3356]
MNSISPSVFGRLFTPLLAVDINQQGLVINNKKHTDTLNWCDLTSPICYEYGVFGQTLRFSTKSRQYRVWMRAYGSHRILKAKTDQLWVNNNIEPLNELLENINQFAHHQFLRQSYVADIKQRVKQQYNRWLPWIKKSEALAVVSTQIKRLEQYSQWSDSLTRFLQHKYTQTQLQRYAGFFDNVEANPLTEKQRRACIIDDDNNLVLAGAGTGKTSVMVARAGYLVNSEQANYDDILLLAYGKQAASEMDERIKAKLNTQAIKTATFHSLGLTIISEVERKTPKISKLAENEKAKIKWVEACFESLANAKPQYAKALVNYINNNLYDAKSEFEFSAAKPNHIALLKEIKTGGYLTKLATLFSQLISVYKTANKTFESDSKQLQQTWKLLKPLLANYNHYLHTQGEIDFDDMILKALDYVTAGKFASPWRYIMVDEFQDISPTRAALVKALRDSKPRSSLFVVGDDWQAIYRFSGADMRLTTEFAAHFGFTTQTILDVTFRFNNKISEVASCFIMKNPAQLAKQINSLSQVTKPAISILKTANVVSSKNTKIAELNNGALAHVLDTINKNKPAVVYLLARYRFQLPTKADINALQHTFSSLQIECDTFHGSKGKEADYVVILGMHGGQFGFPSTKPSPAMLEALLPAKDLYAHSEERRLFYVALTRAKHKVFIISDDNNRSCFVDELINEYQIELKELKNIAIKVVAQV